jgi:ribonuclease III
MNLQDEMLQIQKHCAQLDIQKVRKIFPNCEEFANKLGSIQDHKYTSNAIAIVSLIHRSALIHWPKNRTGIFSNERLEFLGDACLGFVIAQHAMVTFPDAGEGELSRLRSVIAGTEWLANQATKLGLGDLLLMGNGENGEACIPKTNALADVFESTCATLLIDGGYTKAKEWILKSCAKDLTSSGEQFLQLDAKTKFQQWVQSIIGIPPVYQTISESLTTNSNVFEVAGLICDVEIARASGPTKREASKRVAQLAQARVENQTLTAEMIRDYKNRMTS